MTDQVEIIETLLSDVQAALEEDQMQRAEGLVLAALSADPTNKEALKILAGLKFIAGEDVLAFATFKEAMDVGGPLDAESLHGMASIMLRLGRQDQALPVLRQALSIDPTYVPALYDLGLIYNQTGDLTRAIEAFITVSHHQPSHKPALVNCAAAFVRQGKFKQAVHWYGQVLRRYPSDALAWSNLGLVYRLLGVLEPALQCQVRALELDSESPAIHWNNANVLLSLGNYEDGFLEYEWRFRRRQAVDPRETNLPRWDGQSLSGERVLLTAEQGLGDMIQFSRFARDVRLRGGQPILELHPSLVPLFATQPDVEIHVLGEPLPDADFAIPLMSLPHALGLRLEDLSDHPPTLKIAAARPSRFPDAQAVLGFVWRGNKAHEFDGLRSFELEYFLDMIKRPGVELVSLQTDVTEDEKAVLRAHGVHEIGSSLGSFYDTARWMAHMSLVVSADTAALHLAASLKLPSLLLLKKYRDWRWLFKRKDSPWYPTLKVLQTGKHSPEVFAQMMRDRIDLTLGLNAPTTD